MPDNLVISTQSKELIKSKMGILKSYYIENKIKPK
jgi:hypothetical protein